MGFRLENIVDYYRAGSKCCWNHGGKNCFTPSTAKFKKERLHFPITILSGTSEQDSTRLPFLRTFGGIKICFGCRS